MCSLNASLQLHHQSSRNSFIQQLHEATPRICSPESRCAARCSHRPLHHHSSCTCYSRVICSKDILQENYGAALSFQPVPGVFAHTATRWRSAMSEAALNLNNRKSSSNAHAKEIMAYLFYCILWQASTVAVPIITLRAALQMSFPIWTPHLQQKKLELVDWVINRESDKLQHCLSI